MKCPNCEHEIPEDVKICPICGYRNLKPFKILLVKFQNIWKGSMSKFIYLSLFLFVIILAIYKYGEELQVNNIFVDKNFNGQIVLVETQDNKPFKELATGIQKKLDNEYSGKVCLKMYYGNKAVIYISDGIDYNAVLDYIAKPVLTFKREENITGKWIDTDVTDKYIENTKVEKISGYWVVEIEFTSGEGREKFANLTKEMVGQPLGIFVNGELESAPIIREPILGGRAMISGGQTPFTHKEAQNMAQILKSTVDLKVIEIH